MPTELPPSPPPAILVIPPEGRLRAIAAEYGYEFLPPGALAGAGSAPGVGSVHPRPRVEP